MARSRWKVWLRRQDRATRCHVVGITAVGARAEAAHRLAEQFLAALAELACTATDPGIHQPLVAHPGALRLRPHRHHLADDLMAEGVRQRQAELGQLELAAVTEVEITIMDVQIAVANPARLDLDQHLRAFGLGVGILARLERLAPFDNLHSMHGAFLLAAGFPWMNAELDADDRYFRRC